MQRTLLALAVFVQLVAYVAALSGAAEPAAPSRFSLRSLSSFSLRSVIQSLRYAGTIKTISVLASQLILRMLVFIFNSMSHIGKEV